MKVKIERMTSYTKDRDGNFYVAKNGNRYKRVGIHDGEKWYSVFDFDGWTDGWKEGDEIDVEVKEVEKDGKTYYNIEQPNWKKLIEDRLRVIEDKLGIKGSVQEDDEEVPPDSLPF